MPKDGELTAQECLLIKDVLMPALVEAARQHVDRLSEHCTNQFNEAHEDTKRAITDSRDDIVTKIEKDLTDQTKVLNERIDGQGETVLAHDARISKLEKNQKAALLTYGGVVGVVTMVASLFWQYAKDWVLRRLGLKK